MAIDEVFSSAHVLERQMKMEGNLETGAASHCFIESSFYSVHTPGSAGVQRSQTTLPRSRVHFDPDKPVWVLEQLAIGTSMTGRKKTKSSE